MDRETFEKERDRLNEIVLAQAGLPLKRLYNLDMRTYEEGALPVRTKEMLGLVASLALRCDDCVTWHLLRCHELEVSTEEVVEALTVAAVVGGTITIPHLRRALETWDGLAS